MVALNPVGLRYMSLARMVAYTYVSGDRFHGKRKNSAHMAQFVSDRADPDGRIRSRIRQARKERGLTQQAAADKIGWSLRTYIRMENGDTRLTRSKLALLSQALEADVTWLLEADNEPIGINFGLQDRSHQLRSQIERSRGQAQIDLARIAARFNRETAHDTYLSIRTSDANRDLVRAIAGYMQLPVQDTVGLALELLFDVVGAHEEPEVSR
jgi:transcriptional regulator with XRE-family HTH domain